MAEVDRKSGGTGVAKAGLNLLKKLVYENYETPMAEKRSAERQDVVGEVNITLLDASGSPAGVTRAFVRNSSRGGCGLWSRMPMPVGTTVMIAGAAAGDDGASAQRMAKVRHCRGASSTGYAIGVKFEAEARGTGQAA